STSSPGRPAPAAPINLSAASVSVVEMAGPILPTGSTYTITGTPAGVFLQVAAFGPDTVNVRASAAGTTTAILGGSGSHQTFNVGSVDNKLDAIRGGVTVNAGTGGFTTLNINDQGSTTAHTYTQTATTLNRSGAATITFFNITPLHINKGPVAGIAPQAQDLTVTDTVQV